MALSLKDTETDRLAREMAALTGERLTTAIRNSLAERLARERRRRGRSTDLKARLLAIGAACAALPEQDGRSADEIIGYDDDGLW